MHTWSLLLNNAWSVRWCGVVLDWGRRQENLQIQEQLLHSLPADGREGERDKVRMKGRGRRIRRGNIYVVCGGGQALCNAFCQISAVVWSPVTPAHDNSIRSLLQVTVLLANSVILNTNTACIYIYIRTYVPCKHKWYITVPVLYVLTYCTVCVFHVLYTHLYFVCCRRVCEKMTRAAQYCIYPASILLTIFGWFFSCFNTTLRLYCPCWAGEDRWTDGHMYVRMYRQTKVRWWMLWLSVRRHILYVRIYVHHCKCILNTMISTLLFNVRKTISGAFLVDASTMLQLQIILAANSPIVIAVKRFHYIQMQIPGLYCIQIHTN